MSDQEKNGPLEGEEEISAQEQEEASRFANRVDSLLDGDAIPPIMDASDRDLLVLSSIVNSAFTEATLGEDKQASIIDAALGQALNIEPDKSEAPACKTGPIDELSAARQERSRLLPALGVLLVAAAAVLFYFRSTKPPTQQNTRSVAVRELPSSERSRSSDALVGQIERDASKQASSRLDQIYGNRMQGYRSLHFRRIVGSP